MWYAMTRHTATPDEATLSRFLLGTLSKDEEDRVLQWADSSASAAQLLSSISAHDPITDVIGETHPICAADTSAATGGTVPQLVTPGAPALPATIAEYRIVRELGRGGMGVVYEAFDPHLERSVAIKVISDEYANNSDARSRFLCEARLQARIKHENVIEVHQCGEDAGRNYLVMPLLKGETLGARLGRKPALSAAEVTRIGREVAAGLAAAHDGELIHRDIKPANIWLDAATGRAIIIDFGLAKDVIAPTELTATGAVMGTPYYMSPEQAEGQKVDARSDLFSLGAVLYHAATGDRPFKGGSHVAVLIAVKTESPPRAETLNPALPPNLVVVIRDLLEKNPAHRPASAAEVAARLAEIPVSPATASVPAANRTRKPAAPKPSRTRLLALAGIAAALVVVVIVLLVRNPNPRDDVAKQQPDSGAPGDPNAPKMIPPVKPGDPGPAVPQVPPPKQEPNAPATPAERKVAELVIANGGSVQLNDKPRVLRKDTELPPEAFTLTAVNFDRCATDENLAALRDSPNLKDLQLSGNNITPTSAGFANLAPLTRLEVLYLNAPKLGNDDLVHFASAKNLTVLSLRYTRIGDSGLKHLEGHKNLTDLDLRQTRVNDEAVRALAKHLPRCQIVWDNGVIPRTLVSSDPERRAAEFALSTDCAISILAPHLVTLRKEHGHLPRTPFVVSSLTLATNTKLTPAECQNFAGCKNLTYLSMVRYDLTPELLKSFTQLTKLENLSIGSSTITTEGLTTFAECRELKRLSLSGTNVTDEGLKLFKSCSHLADLDLQDTAVGDESVLLFKSCDGLEKLTIKGTNVTARAVEELKKALPRCRIVWNDGVIEPKK